MFQNDERVREEGLRRTHKSYSRYFLLTLEQSPTSDDETSVLNALMRPAFLGTQPGQALGLLDCGTMDMQPSNGSRCPSGKKRKAGDENAVEPSERREPSKRRKHQALLPQALRQVAVSTGWQLWGAGRARNLTRRRLALKTILRARGVCSWDAPAQPNRQPGPCLLTSLLMSWWACFGGGGENGSG